MWYKKNEESTPEKIKFLMQTGQNTACVSGNQKGVIGHADQIRPSQEEIEEEVTISNPSQKLKN